MTYFKKFTDFCGGFSVFAALMVLLREWMGFSELGDAPLRERLALFFSADLQKDHRPLLALVVLTAGALIVSRIFAKHPWVGLLCSVFPMVQVLFFLYEKDAYEHSILSLVLISLFVFGHLADGIVLDRGDGRRRTYFATQLLGILLFLLGLFVYVESRRLIALGTDELSPLRLVLYTGALEGTHTLWLMTSLFSGVGVLLSLWGRDLYFLDLIPSLLPFLLVLRACLGKKESLCFTVLCFFVFLLLVARLLLMLFEPPKKER